MKLLPVFKASDNVTDKTAFELKLSHRLGLKSMGELSPFH